MAGGTLRAAAEGDAADAFVEVLVGDGAREDLAEPLAICGDFVGRKDGGGVPVILVEDGQKGVPERVVAEGDLGILAGGLEAGGVMMGPPVDGALRVAIGVMADGVPPVRCGVGELKAEEAGEIGEDAVVLKDEVLHADPEALRPEKGLQEVVHVADGHGGEVLALDEGADDDVLAKPSADVAHDEDDAELAGGAHLLLREHLAEHFFPEIAVGMAALLKVAAGAKVGIAEGGGGIEERGEIGVGFLQLDAAGEDGIVPDEIGLVEEEDVGVGIEDADDGGCAGLALADDEKEIGIQGDRVGKGHGTGNFSPGPTAINRKRHAQPEPDFHSTLGRFGPTFATRRKWIPCLHC